MICASVIACRWSHSLVMVLCVPSVVSMLRLSSLIGKGSLPLRLWGSMGFTLTEESPAGLAGLLRAVWPVSRRRYLPIAIAGQVHRPSRHRCCRPAGSSCATDTLRPCALRLAVPSRLSACVLWSPRRCSRQTPARSSITTHTLIFTFAPSLVAAFWPMNVLRLWFRVASLAKHHPQNDCEQGEEWHR